MAQRGGNGFPFEGKLTEALAHSAQKPGKYHDGAHGLFLRVNPSGSRQWLQRIVIQGRTRELGLGGYPLVTLRMARETALANRRIARAGGDPRAAPPAGLPEADPRPPFRRSEAPDFAHAMEEVLRLQSPGWRNGGKSAAQWRSSLTRYALPAIGRLPVDGIRTHHVVKALRPIWTAKPETARRVRQRIRAVMDWAVAMEYRRDNPAAAVDALLPAVNRSPVHFRALPHQEVSEAVRRVLGSRAQIGTKLVFGFLVLTASRSGEARLAAFAEIDWSGRVWTVPAARSKTGRAHRVPLSSGSRLLLNRAGGGGEGLIFPSARGRALSDSALSKLLRELGIPAVPHGFRSSFRDWASEVAHLPREVAELALAHSVHSGVEAAYARSDLLERRRGPMQQWCDYLQFDRVFAESFGTHGGCGSCGRRGKAVFKHRNGQGRRKKETPDD